jgi:hypothetical protein
MVCIPGEILDEVIQKSIEAMQTENLVRMAIRAGVDPQEAYIKHGKW